MQRKRHGLVTTAFLKPQHSRQGRSTSTWASNTPLKKTEKSRLAQQHQQQWMTVRSTSIRHPRTHTSHSTSTFIPSSVVAPLLYRNLFIVVDVDYRPADRTTDRQTDRHPSSSKIHVHSLIRSRLCLFFVARLTANTFFCSTKNEEWLFKTQSE